jgi:hypothetical protein
MQNSTENERQPDAQSGLSVTVGSPSEKIVGTGFYREAKPGTFGPNEWLDLLMACQDGRATCLRVMEIMEREAELQRPTAHDMAEAFLWWPLPDSVCADLCATKQGPGRAGTNLLSYTEAKQMFEHVLANIRDEPTRESAGATQSK